MKKVLLICAFAIAGVSSASAIGVGVVFGGGSNGWNFSNGSGGDLGVGLSIGFGDIQDINADLAVRFAFRSNNNVSFFRVAADFDWHLWNLPITDWFQFYISGGLYASLGWYSGSNNNNNTLYLGVGGRLPLGIRFIVIDNLDIWLAFVPAVGLNLGIGGNNSGAGLGGGIGGEMGIRWWF